MGDSHTDNRDKTFLRGYQQTDNAGLATFTTIYPSWCSTLACRVVPLDSLVRLVRTDRELAVHYRAHCPDSCRRVSSSPSQRRHHADLQIRLSEVPIVGDYHGLALHRRMGDR